MKDAEQLLLVIPGVTEAQVFAKVLVRCEFPMADETIVGLQETQDWIEHETGWKVEMTVSAGKRPEPMPRTDNVLQAEFAAWECASGENLLAFEKMLDSDEGRIRLSGWMPNGWVPACMTKPKEERE